MTLTPRENSLLSNTDVLGYIQAKNAERDAQAKAEGWQFWTLMAECLADEYSNVYELELMFARGTYSDMHKDFYYYRPTIDQSLTLAQLEEKIADICEASDREYQRELEAEEAERVYREIWAAADAREEERRAEEKRAKEANKKIDMLYAIQDSLMGY